jgi:hypothetical protein
MRTSNDVSLRSLLKGTRYGLVRWKRAANDHERFATAPMGGYVATVWQDNLGQYYRLENSEGQTQILVTSAENDVVAALFSEAKKRAFNLDRAITDIILSGS